MVKIKTPHLLQVRGFSYLYSFRGVLYSSRIVWLLCGASGKRENGKLNFAEQPPMNLAVVMK